MALVPEPVTKKEVRRYIGGTAFYSHLVDNYAALCAPMHRCTKNDVPDGDVRGHWYLDLEPEDEDFETHWRIRSTGKKIEKDKTLMVSTQTGFEMIKSRLVALGLWGEQSAERAGVDRAVTVDLGTASSVRGTCRDGRGRSTRRLARSLGLPPDADGNGNYAFFDVANYALIQMTGGATAIPVV